MNESAAQLMRQGAYTAIGALGVYATVALGIGFYEVYRAKHRPQQQAVQVAASGGCGCGGGK